MKRKKKKETLCKSLSKEKPERLDKANYQRQKHYQIMFKKSKPKRNITEMKNR